MSDSTQKSAQKSAKKSNKIDDKVQVARSATLAAFKLLGLFTNGKTHGCPVCNANKLAASPKTKIFANSTWKCRRCGAYGGPKHIKGGSKSNLSEQNKGNAIDVVMEATGKSFTEVIDLLLNENSQLQEVNLVSVPEFQATIDFDVYNAILNAGSVEKAIEFYGRWYISPESVENSRCTYIDNIGQLVLSLKKDFGIERLVAAGVVTEPTEFSPKGTFLANSRYCVVEPQLDVSGNPTNLQFRASPEQEARIREYKEYKAQVKLAEEIGSEPPEKINYVPKFLSMRGATSESRVGFGLPQIVKLPDGSTIWIVEGMKDKLAANTFGLHAYGLPGVGVYPSEDTIKILSKHHIKVAYDGDVGGNNGRLALLAHFKKFGLTDSELSKEEHIELSDLAKKIYSYRQKRGLTVTHKYPPEGMDMADVLVSKKQGL